MARRIDEENHPEILLQVQLYGWLFERSCGAAPKGLQVHAGTGEIVTIPYDGGADRFARVGATSGPQATDARNPTSLWAGQNVSAAGSPTVAGRRQRRMCDVALVYCVDQSLARTLHSQGVRTRKELLANFDAASLSELKRPYGNREQRVGKAAERILQVR